MTTPITLESVALAFNNWRRQRTSLSDRIPLDLQQQAIQLLQFHSKPEVIKALNINHKMLKRWQQPTDTTCEFIDLAGDPPIVMQYARWHNDHHWHEPGRTHHPCQVV